MKLLPGRPNIFLIAEAGVNHNGDIDRALQLIDAAADCGADAVKFQTFCAADLASASARKARYQIESGEKEDTQLSMLSKLELDKTAHLRLMNRCRKRKIEFLSTPFDHTSIDLLHQLGLHRIKISSGDLVNLPFLEHIGSLGKGIILSSGMGTLGEIEVALEVLEKSGTSRESISILHANTAYPTPFEDVNLLAMRTIAKAFGLPVGYSDHTRGIEVPAAAAALGAAVIEKHFTLDRSLPGPDHRASLIPEELANMVTAVRNVEAALGSPRKRGTSSEAGNRSLARKSLVLRMDLSSNTILGADHIAVKRPAGGIEPFDLPKILGMQLMKDLKADTPLQWEHLKP